MRLGKGIRLYAVVTQFLLQTFALVIIGIYAGSKIDARLGTDTLYSGILGLVGALVGLFFFAFYVYKLGKRKNGTE